MKNILLIIILEDIYPFIKKGLNYNIRNCRVCIIWFIGGEVIFWCKWIVLQSFKTVFGRDLRANLDYETEKYRVFSDPSIYVFEIKDQDDYIYNYEDLYNFVNLEAESVLADFKEGELVTKENDYPEYAYRFIVENEGPAIIGIKAYSEDF